MLCLVRDLNEGNDAAIASLKTEGAMLDARLANQSSSDNSSLEQLSDSLVADRSRLRQLLAEELSSVQRISEQRVAKLIARDPVGASCLAHGGENSVEPTAPTAEKVVDFWRGKQEASQGELRSVEAQLFSIRSKIDDVRTASGESSDDHGQAKLLCMIGALRQKLQQARSRTQDYQRLLSSVEEINLPRSAHAKGAAAVIEDAGDTEERSLRSDIDQEALALCLVESSLINELECAREYAELARARKESLQSKVAFLTQCLEMAEIHLPEPPAECRWPPVRRYDSPISEEMYAGAVEREKVLEIERVTAVRERHVTMMRQMDPETMKRWVEKQRLARLALHTEGQVEVASKDKATVLFRIDEVATHGKVSTQLMGGNGPDTLR